MFTSPLRHPRRLVAGALAIAAAAAIATPALARTSHAGASTMRYYEKTTEVHLMGADGKPKPLGPPVAGDVLDASGVLYKGDHRNHARRPSGTDHTRCTFTGPDAATCQGEVALGGSLILTRTPEGAGNGFTIWYGTGRYSGIKGSGTTTTVTEQSNDSDVVVRYTLG